ncbi:MAG: hypothetical protein RLZZ326_376, partial [Planctomycetota bacterium]
MHADHELLSATKLILVTKKPTYSRASHVEPDADGNWGADMGPVDGPVLGPFKNRSEALGAERGWLVGY